MWCLELTTIIEADNVRSRLVVRKRQLSTLAWSLHTSKYSAALRIGVEVVLTHPPTRAVVFSHDIHQPTHLR